MTDNGIKREKTFSEELPYFKEQMKEVFDYYDNPKGCSEMLYISVLNDSNRIVRKAEEEINRLQAENERLKKEKDEYAYLYDKHINTAFSHIKSEAVKKFANEFKSRCIKGGIYPAFVNRQLENVKKEMVGEDK